VEKEENEKTKTQEKTEQKMIPTIISIITKLSITFIKLPRIHAYLPHPCVPATSILPFSLLLHPPLVLRPVREIDGIHHEVCFIRLGIDRIMSIPSYLEGVYNLTIF
jgi:hypothetical protein